MVLSASARATTAGGHGDQRNIQIERQWCKGCGICAAFCPRGVFAEEENGLAIVAAVERCTLCGLCELLCPELAISTRKVWTRASRHRDASSRRGPAWPEPAHSIPSRSPQVTLMQGNEACAEAALAAGMRFFAGYPITPSSDIPEILSRRLPQVGGIFIQMEDELASLAAVVGAAMGGLRAMTATSGPGFSLMQENLGYAIAAEIPCVIVDVQRSGPSTGQPTGPAQGDVMQCRWGTHGDHHIIVLCPSSVAETYRLTIHAFDLAERYRTPVILLTDEVVAHMHERVTVPVARMLPPREREVSDGGRYLPYDTTSGDVPPFVSFGRGVRYHVTGLHHDPAGFPTQRADEVGLLLERLKRKIEGHVDEITLVEEEATGDADVLVLAYGVTARSAREAVLIAREAGQRLGFLKLLTLWPFPERALRRLCGQVRAVIVPEMNQGQLRLEVERLVGHCTEVVGVNRVDGELISPDQILRSGARLC